MMRNKMSIIISVIVICIILLCGYFYCEKKYDEGYDFGYKDGYSKGYSDGYEDKGKLSDNSTVKTETKIIYEKIPYNGNDVQVKTEPPKVTVSINGKKQEIKQKTETADLQVKTDAEVKIKIPERKWHVGIGTDGKHLAGTVKIPVKDAIGVWVSGTKGKVMGGISVSF